MAGSWNSCYFFIHGSHAWTRATCPFAGRATSTLELSTLHTPHAQGRSTAAPLSDPHAVTDTLTPTADPHICPPMHTRSQIQRS